MDMFETLAAEHARINDAMEQGTICRACGQHVQRYRRRINSGMARALIALYHAGGHSALCWVHKPTALKGLGAAARDESLLRYWSLIEECKEPRPDGGRAGWWRLTPLGEAFALGRARVSLYAWVYNGEFSHFEGGGCTITDCLGDRFDYADLMDPQRRAS